MQQEEKARHEVCSQCGEVWNVSIFHKNPWWQKEYLCPDCRERRRRYGLQGMQKTQAVPNDCGDVQQKAGGTDRDGAGKPEACV